MSIPELHKLFTDSTGICTDSRQPLEGGIFFALKGANFNGNEHAISALEQGCAYAVVDEQVGTSEKLIQIESVLETLKQLANHHRNAINPFVLGITGSNGKTTTKELVHAVLKTSYKTHCTTGNFNNHIGVPLTLLAMPEDTEMAIVEMGANHVGEIRDLSAICDPDLGVITNIGKAHLEGFGGYQGVIKAKGELYDHIASRNDGELLVCADDDLLLDLSKDLDKTTYGISETANVRGSVLGEVPFLNIEWQTDGSGPFQIKTQLSGSHNFQNIMCAVCAGVKLNVSPEMISRAIEEHVPENNRSQWVRTEKNQILLDAYNANPTSLDLAIRNFIKLQDRDQLMLLGDMKELGEYSLEEHRKIVSLVEVSGRQAIYIGPEFGKVISHQRHFNTTNELIAFLEKEPVQGKQILIKGSRVIALEKVIDVL